MLPPARRSLLAGTLLLAVLGLPAAAAAAPPPQPAAPSLERIALSSRFDVRVTWTAVAGTRYRVERMVDSQGPYLEPVPAAPTSALRLVDVKPGALLRVRIVAINGADEESPASAWASIALPRLVTSAAATLTLRTRPVSTRRCGTDARPCAVEQLDGWVLRVATAPRPRAAQYWVERRVRLANDARFHGLPAVLSGIGVGPRHGFEPLAAQRYRVAAGTYCLRAVIRASQQLVRSTSGWRCLHVKPRITIGWAGDTTLGSRAYGNPPSGGMHVFDGVLALLRAPDLMIGNYEGTLSRGGTPRCSGGAGCYIFQAPPRNARALAHAGFDVMNLANNHGLDMGEGARRQTVLALGAAGVGHAGLPGAITYRTVRETRVAIIGFGFSPGNMLLSDLGQARTMVRRAAARADVVVVAMHAGAEGARAAHVPYGAEDGFGQNRGNTRAFTHAVVDAGADVVVGSSPHVVRGVERRRGKLIFYSTGNFSGWHNFALGGLSSQSGVVHVTIDLLGRTRASRWHSVRLDGPGLPVRAGRAIPRRVDALSRADFGRSAARVRANGVIW